MKISPQNLKFKKYHKPNKKLHKFNSNFKLRFGDLGLRSTTDGALSFAQIESGRKALRRFLRKVGSL